LAVADTKGQRVVIDGFSSREVGGRGENFDGRTGEVEGGLGVVADDRDFQSRGVSEERGLRICAYPELFWTEVFEDCGQASDVVLMGVGGDNDVEALNASGPKIGRDYVFAGIEGSRAGSAELKVASAVYQHFCAGGENN
jgi:hypothetical protein